MIEAKNVAYRLGQTEVLSGLSFTLAPGKLYGIIGPNGVGKSSLLRLISGVEKPAAGQLLLEGKQAAAYPRKELARWLSVLQQGGLPPVGFTVRETVAMGRFPFQNWLGDEEADTEALIDSVLEAMGLSALQHRTMDNLSGGERQRVALAQVMAQQPRLVLLDEPTTYLDIGFQVLLMDTVSGWQRKRGLTAIAVLHDLNLASLYCDEILVLHEGQLAAFGPPADILDAALVRRVYGTEAAAVAHPANGRPQFLLMNGK
ncbi:ABC transporter ATP-binding protein [Paenibacillus beijingensis]|uniref:ABC transporter ATP-binding protein n=1 Tax=Paenibacillus beijingensis TaxID=1126833 RepID=A0A0D5NN26_9BACL|nr:ABC transporter ATP-binding protein [Paenibacillus beijingensis]AJY76656.1 ABC transporter ATP-binding protein [Paenibacillus beijingensis]